MLAPAFDFDKNVIIYASSFPDDGGLEISSTFLNPTCGSLYLYISLKLGWLFL